jgi:hypothetical protein
VLPIFYLASRIKVKKSSRLKSKTGYLGRSAGSHMQAVAGILGLERYRAYRALAEQSVGRGLASRRHSLPIKGAEGGHFPNVIKRACA